MSPKLPSQPGKDWRWARLAKPMACPKCGKPISTTMNVIVVQLRPAPDAEPVEVPLHPMCAAAVSAARVLFNQRD